MYVHIRRIIRQFKTTIQYDETMARIIDIVEIEIPHDVALKVDIPTKVESAQDVKFTNEVEIAPEVEIVTDEIEVEIVAEDAKSKYSLEYLMKFIKAKVFADKVTLKFSNDYPLRMDFAGQKMGIGFVLAPRVEND